MTKAQSTRNIAKPKPQNYNGPKHVITPFIMYCNEHRPQVVAQMTDGQKTQDVRETVRRLTAMWKELSDEDRKVYENKVAMERKSREEAMSKWETTEDFKRYKRDLDDFKIRARRDKQQKKKRPEGQPRKPAGAFMLFFQSIRPDMLKKSPNLIQRDLSKQVGAKWNEMSSTEREPYQQEYQRLKNQYDQDMKEWRLNNGGAGGESESEATEASEAGVSK